MLIKYNYETYNMPVDRKISNYLSLTILKIGRYYMDRFILQLWY